jgi:hypothetical protein
VITNSIDPLKCPNGQELLTWFDANVDPSNFDESSSTPGPDERMACVPATAPSSPVPVPVVLWNPPSFGAANQVYTTTTLAELAQSYVWPNGARGFVLLSMQPRNLALGDLGAGAHEDRAYRPIDPAQNPDLRNADALLDWAIAHYGSAVDPKSIFETGWSNGAFQAELHGMARNPSTHLALPGSAWGSPTPGGHYVAAVSVYSASDPFSTLIPGCGTAEYPTTNLPIHDEHRTCDLVPCETTQEECYFAEQPLASNIGSDMTATTWRARLVQMGDAHVEDVLLDSSSSVASHCVLSRGGPNTAASTTCQPFPSWIPLPDGGAGAALVRETPTSSTLCTADVQLANHISWPFTRERAMFDFLAKYLGAG